MPGHDGVAFAVVDASPEAVAAVLADGRHYGSWLVGCARVEDVGPGWPEVGSRLLHARGGWPFLVRALLEVVEHEVHPDGSARTVLREPRHPRAPAGTLLVLDVEPVPVRRSFVRLGTRSAVPPVLAARRGAETLRRLGLQAAAVDERSDRPAGARPAAAHAHERDG